MPPASGSSSEPPDLPTGDPSELADDLDAALGRFVSDARVDEAAASRRRRHAMQTAAAQDSTMLGMFVEIAELGLTATVSLRNDHTIVGGVSAVGLDYVMFRSDGSRVLVPLDAIVGFELPAGTLVFGVDRTPTHSTRFCELFPALAEEPAVVRVLAGSETVQGVLTSAGTDVFTVETPSPRWLRIAAVDAVRTA